MLYGGDDRGASYTATPNVAGGTTRRQPQRFGLGVIARAHLGG